MKSHRKLWSCVVIAACLTWAGHIQGQEAAPSVQPAVRVVAILPFQERGTGAAKRGTLVSDLLFAELSNSANLLLVEREELNAVGKELELNLSGLVNSTEAVRVGSLTGARLLVTGSIVNTEDSQYLIAKIISTETTRVLGVSVKGKAGDKLDALVAQLGKDVEKTITERANELVAVPNRREDRIAEVRRQLDGKARPRVWIEVAERHVGQTATDPAAQTEFTLLMKQLGFEVLDHREAADVVVTGEGVSEFATRLGNLISVKSRLEVKAVNRTSGEVVAVDRQVSVAVDLVEQIAGKAALQLAAEELALRLAPKLAR